MRKALALLPLTLVATPAPAQQAKPTAEVQRVLSDPATADRLANVMQALSQAFLDLPVGSVEAAVEGRPPTTADRTNVAGSANLAGSLSLLVAAGTYTVNKQYVLLHADGGRTGTFTTGDITGLFGNAIRARIDYTANDVILNLAPNAIWLVRASGGAPVQLTDAIHFNSSPVFTPGSTPSAVISPLVRPV